MTSRIVVAFAGAGHAIKLGYIGLDTDVGSYPEWKSDSIPIGACFDSFGYSNS